MSGGGSSAGGSSSGGGSSGGSTAGGSTSGGATAGGNNGGGASGGVTSGGGAAGGAATTVGMFVAIGHVRRSILSCDDGRTWVGNRSDFDELRCFSSASPDGGSADCDHHYGAGRGIAWTQRAGFVANWGWGDPGVIRKSADGVGWQTVDQGSNFASMTVGSQGTLYAAARTGKLSTDDGATWRTAGTANLMANGMPVYNVRRGGAGGTGAGVFVVVADSNTAMVSADGQTWAAPVSYPTTCGANIQWEGGVASGNGVLVILGGDGVACRSTDNGRNWTAHPTGSTSIESRLLWTGTEFVTFGSVSNQRRLLRSLDGMTWSSVATVLRRNGTVVAGNGPSIGAVARSPAGTYVAVNGGWQQWYASQRFFRSTDGITWDELPAGAFVGSHPIQHIVWGEGRRSAVCP